MLTKNDIIYYNEMITESKNELDSIGIKYCPNITWKTFKRNNTWGQCQKQSGYFTIKITEVLIKSRNNESIKNTIIHELLHSCPGCMDHTGKWLEYAGIVNSTFGYNIKRIDSVDEKGLTGLISYKYKAVCNNCGKIYYFNKLNKFIKLHGNGYLCGKCKHSEFTIYDYNGNII